MAETFAVAFVGSNGLFDFASGAITSFSVDKKKKPQKLHDC